ncbi:peptide/nickel transport system ATP-binding protein [Kaistia hirudinis]|uniref:Peptide/nickel transport system ATP-binding protein n=1 Tax=Kaistia hirudinis TaxID=1293440 RepID=A0A840AK50_9HYPH|nr:ABC transporter ATP-binding protein [Kaistia hirudinis]MBB3929311.1 peptide/nickel transport system ATP-binding protein [Kaistia hirudinis]
MTDILLDARGLEVTYGRRHGLLAKSPGTRVLHGVDVSIRRGETVGIVGESGSGKTTLGRALLRLVPVSAGSIRFGGEDITAASPERMRAVRRRMQMIFQDPMASLNPRHTIRTILTAPLLLHGVAPNQRAAEERAHATLARVSLPELVLDRYPHELSGGQRQRIGIARAALLEPDFVLADEIVSGLDVSTQAQVLRLLKDLSREMGLAMAFISHDLSVIRAVCDRVYVMRLGRVVEEGPCERIFANPGSDYTRLLIDAIPLPDIDPHWLDSRVPAGRELENIHV